MHIRRLLAFAAAATAASLLSGLPASGAPPTAPPNSQPPSTDVPVDADTQAGHPAGDTDDGVVHSWALGAAGADESGGNRPNLSYSGAPGQVIHDAVTLYNFGNQDLPFRVYPTDAYNDEDGAFTLLVGDEVPTDAGSWIKLDAEHIEVPAGKQATIPFTLTIPSNAAPGDHAGAVLASSPTVGQGENNELLTLDRRTGTRLYVRVDGPLEPELTVENLATDYSGSANPLGGSATVTYRVENRGNVRVSGTAVASVSGPFGVARKTAEPIQFEDLLPGEGFDVTAEFDGVPALVALNTDVDLQDVTGGDGQPLDPAGRSSTGLALPVTVLLVLLLLVFGVLAMRAIRRNRERVEVLPPDPVHHAHDDEHELQST